MGLLAEHIKGADGTVYDLSDAQARQDVFKAVRRIEKIETATKNFSADTISYDAAAKTLVFTRKTITIPEA